MTTCRDTAQMTPGERYRLRNAEAAHLHAMALKATAKEAAVTLRLAARLVKATDPVTVCGYYYRAEADHEEHHQPVSEAKRPGETPAVVGSWLLPA